MTNSVTTIKVQGEVNKLLYKHLPVALIAESLAAVCLTYAIVGINQ